MKTIELRTKINFVYCYHPLFDYFILINWDPTDKILTLKTMTNKLDIPKNISIDLEKVDYLLLNSDSEDYNQWLLKIDINKTQKNIELKIIKRPSSELSDLIILDRQIKQF